MKKISILLLVLLLLVGCTAKTADESDVFHVGFQKEDQQTQETNPIESDSDIEPISNNYSETLEEQQTVMMLSKAIVTNQEFIPDDQDLEANAEADQEVATVETKKPNRAIIKEEPKKEEPKKEEPVVQTKPKVPVKQPVVVIKIETKTEAIAFKTISQDDNTLEKGKTVVKQAGAEGILTTVQEVTYTDGKVAKRITTETKVTKAAQDKIILVGTKVVQEETKPEEPKPEEPNPEVPKPVNSDQAFVNEVVRLTNLERTKRGLTPLKATHTQLNSAASIRAKEIIQKFAHTRPDGTSWNTVFKDVGIASFSARGENLLWNGAQWNPEKVVQKWMDSDAHRANILSKNYEYIGVGFIRSGNRDGVTQLFYRPK